MYPREDLLSSCVDESDSIQLETKRIRLLKVVTNYGTGGTEKQVYNFVRNLDRTQFELLFACQRKWGVYLEEYEQREIPVREFPISNLYQPHTLFQQIKLAAFMRAQKIQIVHSYNFYANVFAIPAARMAGVEVIFASIRDRGIYLTSAQKIVQKWVCRLADRILVNADSVRDWLLEEGYQEEKIVVIKNGIDISLYAGEYLNPDSQSTIRRDLGIPQDVPVVVMLSRLVPEKGVDDFIKAAALLRYQHPHTHYLIIGEKMGYRDGIFTKDEDYHESLRQLSINLGMGKQILFAGLRSDVPELLAEACVSVLPSYSEGLSNTLLESMAAGLPLVATNVGGNPELVEEGVNGYLVPPRDPQALAAGINKLLSNPQLARAFSNEARKKVTQEFSLSNMVSITQSLYLGALKHRLQSGNR